MNERLSPKKDPPTRKHHHALLAGGGRQNMIATGIQDRLHEGADIILVFNDQDLVFIVSHFYPPDPERTGSWHLPPDYFLL